MKHLPSLLFLCLLLITGNVIAEEEKKENADVLAEIISKGKQKKPLDLKADPARPIHFPGVSKNEKTQALYDKALQSYYRYRIDGLDHRKRIFKWQLTSSIIIFAMVLLVVISGLVFAAIQFKQGIKPGGGKSEELSTEVEVSTKGVKLSSPVLGVIILFISLGFFYLYLVHIYPIENIF